MYIPRSIWQIVYYIPINNINSFENINLWLDKWEIIRIHIRKEDIEYIIKTDKWEYTAKELFPSSRKWKERIREIIQNRFELQFDI
jgi:hypothetical protein